MFDDDDFRDPVADRHKHLIDTLSIISDHLRQIRSSLVTILWMVGIVFFTWAYNVWFK